MAYAAMFILLAIALNGHSGIGVTLCLVAAVVSYKRFA